MRKKVFGIVCCVIGVAMLLLIFQHIYFSRLVMKFSILDESSLYHATYVELYRDRTIHIVSGERREDNNLDAEDYIIVPNLRSKTQGELSREQYKMCIDMCNTIFAECKSRPFSESLLGVECMGGCLTYCLSYKDKSFYLAPMEPEEDEYTQIRKLGKFLEDICEDFGVSVPSYY